MSWLASLIISGLMIAGAGDAGNPVQVNALNAVPPAGMIDAPPPEAEESESFAQTYPLDANGRVAVSNVNGSVMIEAWDRNEIKVEYTKTASEKEILSWVNVEIDSNRGNIRIEANYDNWKERQNGNRENWKGRKLNVNFKLTVPRGALLDEIETVNGVVSVSNLTNSCKISTVNGQVIAKNLRGSANLSTVNGYVSADFDRLESGSNISLNTVNGQATLTIPSDSSVTIKADTLNGAITNDFGLPVSKGKYVGRNLHGRIGTGDVSVKLSSVNGPLSISRKQDGRTPAPATNLLRPNRPGDDDDDIDVDVDVDVEADVNTRVQVDTAKIDREVRRAVRDASRAVADARIHENVQHAAETATQEALKEVAEMQREIAQAALVSTQGIQSRIQAGLDEKQLVALTGIGSAGLPSMSRKTAAFPVKGVPRVSVDAKSCAVIVRGWDKPEVSYSLTAYSRAAGPDLDSQVKVESDDSKVKIKINSSPAGRYRLEVFVPKKTNLSISTDREIRLDGVAGELELESVNEPVNVRDSEGSLITNSIAGNLRVVGFAGDVSATTVRGTLSFEGVFNKLSANAGSGNILLTMPGDSGIFIPGVANNVFVEGFAAAKDDAKWKIGSGGETYRLAAGPQGKVIIRNGDKLKANLTAGLPSIKN